MKFIVDLLPLLAFFAVYKAYGVMTATAAAMAVATAQAVWSRLRHGRVPPAQLATLALLLVLGGATLALRDELFIKWKPTVLDWGFALAFLLSPLVGGKPLVQRMLGGSLSLRASLWHRLNGAWAGFFALLGAANLYVAYHFDTDVWVDFKLFGTLGLTLAFVLGQMLFLARHLRPLPERD